MPESIPEVEPIILKVNRGASRNPNWSIVQFVNPATAEGGDEWTQRLGRGTHARIMCYTLSQNVEVSDEEMIERLRAASPIDYSQLWAFYDWPEVASLVGRTAPSVEYFMTRLPSISSLFSEHSTFQPSGEALYTEVRRTARRPFIEWATQVFDALMAIWPLCGMCSPECHLPADLHEECEHCAELIQPGNSWTLMTQDEGEQLLCHGCYNSTDLISCQYCGNFWSTMPDDWDEEYDECYECSSNRSVMSCCGHGYRGAAPRYYPEVDMCEQCSDNTHYLSPVHNWDYRPDLVFHPSYPETANHLYIGMEFEVSFDGSRYRDEHHTAYWREHLPEDLIYVKHDSSVSNGYEIVTHPMNPRWALENFPFEAFESLVQHYGANETNESTGTHIHMNKDAFTSAQMWKMIQLHDRLPEFCQLVGGRKSTRWGSFEGDMKVQREAAMEIAKAKGKTSGYYQRYIALNLRPEYTMELRYPRGGIAVSEIKKNMEWAQALYDFTNFVTVEDVRNGVMDDQGYFLWWLQEKRDAYPHLMEWIDKRVPMVKAIQRKGETACV